MKNSKNVKSNCKQCNRTTNHVVIHEETISGDPNEYAFCQEYQLVQCMGCDTYSFRINFVDFEAGYPDQYTGEWIVPENTESFPKFLKGHTYLETHYMPTIVSNIYEEILKAINEDALILAGIGLRTVIEAICNEEQIKGKDLQTKIKKMSTNGLISLKDANRLHSIRFLGNDCAHDIKNIASVR